MRTEAPAMASAPAAAAPALLPCYAQYPFTLVAGDGARVRDAQGREYWDFYGGHAVALLGHSHPAVAEAVAAQARRLTFYSNVAPLEIRTQAAEALTAFAGGPLRHVFFCNSGAEANENALKLALAHTQRPRVAALSGGFHGRTLLALSATDGEKLRGPFADVLVDCVRLRPNAVEDVEQIDTSVAAVIVEPVQSMAGVIELSREFLHALRRRCDAVGAYLIYDEVQTGMGRLGRPLAAGRYDVWPDMVTLAKGIANGIPAGAVLMTPEIAQRVRLGDLGSTFGGGPVACAAMLAVLKEIRMHGLVEHARRLGGRMRECLRVGPVEQVCGCGCLIGLRTWAEARSIQQELLERGFLTGASGDAHVLRLMPPINLPLEAVDALAAALCELG